MENHEIIRSTKENNNFLTTLLNQLTFSAQKKEKIFCVLYLSWIIHAEFKRKR